MAEVLTMHLAEVDEVKKVGGDHMIDVSLPANRVGDLAGHRTLAGEICAVTGSKMKVASLKLGNESSKKAKDFLIIKIENPNACRRYSARMIEGVKVGPSPQWLKERLNVLGLKSINNIVDLANYVMLEMGQPLHVFDYDKLEGKTIIVRRAKKGEKLNSLDNVSYTLDSDILMIADKKKSVAIAGIKGGANSGVDQKTKTIVIESANFDPIVTRRASRKLKLRTDASIRFEHGLDPSMTIETLDRVAGFVQEHAGGAVLRGVVDVFPKKSPQRVVEFDPAFTNQLLGENIPQQKAMAILDSLGFRKAKTSSRKVIPLLTPLIRRDIEMREDIVEEVGRIWGYEKIKENLLKAHNFQKSGMRNCTGQSVFGIFW